MFTDIKDFTSQTSKKSREEIDKLIELQDELIRPVFAKFDGRVVKTIGDAFLVVFKSPTDAVLCGMRIQDVLRKHNEKADEEIEVKIAINAGEVNVRKNDVFGEPVNITSRIEGIAEPGEIYFTEAVYLSMNKKEIPSAEIGHRYLKGIPHEIKVYKVLREGAKTKNKIFRKERPFGMKAPLKKKILKILMWVGIVFIVLFIIGQWGFGVLAVLAIIGGIIYGIVKVIKRIAGKMR